MYRCAAPPVDLPIALAMDLVGEKKQFRCHAYIAAYDVNEAIMMSLNPRSTPHRWIFTQQSVKKGVAVDGSVLEEANSGSSNDSVHKDFRRNNGVP